MRNISSLSCVCLLLVFLSGCTETQFLAHMFKQATPPDTKSVGDYKVGNPYKIMGRWYYPKEEFNKVETGIASWYGPNFHGKPTANGERFDQNELTAAHRTLQIPSIVRVTNLDNGRSLILRVNDRGPFSRGRILDVSKRGSELLGFKRAGTARVRVEVMEQESRYAKSLAKQGQSTSGLEIALNRGEKIPTRSQEPRQDDIVLASTPPINTTAVKPVSVSRESLPSPVATAQPTSLKEAEKLVRSTPPVKTDLFVQAGAFSNYGNAARLRTKLARLGNSEISETSINGTTLYRVRIGPMDSVVRADTVLQALTNQGNPEAIIVVQ